MSEQQIYRHLIDRLKQSWWDLPEANELIPLMMVTFTHEEASLLADMPLSARNLKELADTKQTDPTNLRRQLDLLAKKGLVFRTLRDDSVHYRLNDSFFIFLRSTFWAGDTDERTKAIAPLVNQYYYHGFFDDWDYTHLKGLRVLPIQEVIEDPHQILPYEEVVKVLDSLDYFAVSICPCKHRKNIDPDSPDCRYPTEVCLHFGQLGRYTVENGLGREITRQETREILRQSAEAGLVHGVSNHQQGADTICNCDPCCCMWFEAFYKLKHSMSISPSNYRVCTNAETCIGDGLCVKRCPMGAMRLEDFPDAKNRITRVTARNKSGDVVLKNKIGKVAVSNPDLCIGCGVCAYKCPAKSLILERREVSEDPPETARDYTRLIMEDFAVARARQRGEENTDKKV